MSEERPSNKPDNLLIQGGRILDPSQGIDMVGDLLTTDGRVAWVGGGPLPERYSLLCATGMVVCPGFIDLHCHLRQPGFEEKETIATGTRAAARGGFTTVCCMPNTNPPIDTGATVEYVRRQAEATGMVRVLPIGCITKGQKGKELTEMDELAEAGVVGFSDDANSVRDSRLMRHALEYSRAFGLPIIEHCEDPALTLGGVMNEGWVATRLGLKGVPAAAEESIVARDIALAQLTGARLHIAHMSTKGSVELLRRAKNKGVPVTGEVTPHHLTLTEERVMNYSPEIKSPKASGQHPPSPISCDTRAKVNPPLRTMEDIQALVQGLREGVIDAIATDHAPHTAEDKLCEFDLAAFGISGFETALASLMSLVHSGELDLITLISKLTIEPARVIGTRGKSVLPSQEPLPKLGTLAVGAPGDVTIFHPEAEWVVDPNAFASKGKNTPLTGHRLKGKVMATVFGGKIVYQDEQVKLKAGG